MSAEKIALNWESYWKLWNINEKKSIWKIDSTMNQPQWITSVAIPIMLAMFLTGKLSTFLYWVNAEDVEHASGRE